MTKALGSAAVAALLSLSLSGSYASADVWDVQTRSDNFAGGTTNELLHGTVQHHDLSLNQYGADVDWYMMPQRPRASYEVVVDSVSGDFGINFELKLERLRQAGSVVTLLQTGDAAVADSFGFTKSLRWVNTSTSTQYLEYVRVSGALCGTTCGADDAYAIRARETTVNVPRFNASGTQSTILLTQNASERPVNATFFYWSATGTLFYTETLSLVPKALNVLNLGGLAALAGRSGHITVAHDGSYGALVVKAVSLEPSTGFSFDTAGVYVPN